MEIVTDCGVYKVYSLDKRFLILVYCPVCRKIVEPDEVSIGHSHIYAVHCGYAQEVAVISRLNLSEGVASDD